MSTTTAVPSRMEQPKVNQLLGPALKSLYDIEAHLRKSTLEPELRELIKLRVSQINRCAYCIIYLVGPEGGLEGSMFGVLPLMNVAATNETFRGQAMRYLGELMWNPDAILFNSHLQWRIPNSRTLSVAAGDGPRRCEIRLLLDQSGDAVRFEADDRPRLEGSAFTRSAWFGRCWDYRTIGGRRIPIGAEAGWILQGKEFIYWRGKIEDWHAEH